MSPNHFHNLKWLLLLWGLPVLGLLFAYAGHRRRLALERFAEAGILGRLRISSDPVRRCWQAIWILLGLACIVVALSRPAWNLRTDTVQRRGRDVVFVLDVSRSMLGEDLFPNRLERAKLAIRDCIKTFSGDRVGLVVFAGTATVKCPLTLDYGFFRLALDQVSPDSVPRGGTLVGDAIRCAIDEVFDDSNPNYRDLILITDGGDHESSPVEAAHRAGEKQIRILAIGLGDEDNQRPIPITDPDNPRRKIFIEHHGERVALNLDADLLRQVAAATPGGKYLNVATGNIDLDLVYADLVASAEKRDFEARTIQRYEEKFQIFLALALLILALEFHLGERRRPLPEAAL